jgi:acyl carrier protein
MTTPEETRVRRILAEVCRVDEADLRDDTQLVRDLGLDSATTLDLLITLEEELDREISEVEAAELVSVGDVLAFVRRSGASS